MTSTISTARYAFAATMTLVATSFIATTPSAAASGAKVIKVCDRDNYKEYCQTRSSYDSNFNNDKFCYHLSNGAPTRDVSSCPPAIRTDFEDKISSFKNYTPYWWKMYEDRDYKGYTLCVRPQGYDADLGNNTSMEDDISSIKKFGTSKPSGCDKTVG